MRARALLVAALALTLGCQGGVPTISGAGGSKGKAPAPARSQAPAPTALGATKAAIAEAKRVIDATDLTSKTKLVPVELVGKAKLISDKGLGILSNNAGGLISNNGGGLVSDAGGGLVSNQRQ